MDLVRLEVTGLTNDPVANTPILILSRDDGKGFLPIWIGLCEANAIALKLEAVTTPRPMTHDLLLSILEGQDAKLQDIVISSIQDNVFRAELRIRRPDGSLWIVDARPSDAVAVALRAGVPIFTAPEVLDHAQMTLPRDENEALQLFLQSLDPKDMGKYEM
jgi:bifunctional DNase/RNase